MFERVKDVFNAALGRKATCGGNCYGPPKELAEFRGELGEFIDYDFSMCSPELQEVIDNMLQPEGLAKLQEELDRVNAAEAAGEALTDVDEDSPCGDPTDPAKPCIHMEVIFKCHVSEGDMKPANCSLSTCPARAQAHIREQMKEAQNAHMFN